MSAFSAALRLIKAEISPTLLEQAFTAKRYDPVRSDRRYDRRTPVNTEQVILDKIIRGRVMLDMDMMTGTEVSLPLNEAEVERVDDYNHIYRFNEQTTGGRTITQALEITYGYLKGTMVGAFGGIGGYSSQSSQLLKTARDILDTTPAPSGTAYIDIVGHNTVLLNEVSPINSHGVLRCIVTNDPDLRNWSPAYHIKFAELALAATQNYIYTQLSTEVDIAELFAGVALSKITEEINKYADAGQIYRDLLRQFPKLSILNDRTRKKRVVKLMLGKRPTY